jgi:poly(hydroxyalkanoate) depolymerase family esterase
LESGGIADTINRALAAAGLMPKAGTPGSDPDSRRPPISRVGWHFRPGAPDLPQRFVNLLPRAVNGATSDTDSAPVATSALSTATPAGQFVSRSFTNGAGTRTYKLYIPASYSGQPDEPVPLIVMLHGCTQSPDDFAAGSGMNALADQHGFLVVYPAQAGHANGSRCWNWFRREDQNRDSGEPSLIAGITREIAAAYRVDARRIFVAGLSAGAAMAVILGTTYPDLYAAVGAHSGLPYGAAHDMGSAMTAMGSGPSIAGIPLRSETQAAQRSMPLPEVSTIVFHGDRDYTVNARNGAAIVAQATASRAHDPDLRKSVVAGVAAGGRTYSRTVYADRASQPVIEQWMLDGAGHAWSGGSPSGSFTDANGPDASAEMVRFFLAQRRPDPV